MNKSKTDRLYILDSWGFKGSYYLYENGKKYPEEYKSNLITSFLSKGYKKVYMIGSSKGGTCAIYYGIKHHADEIISGACQYNLGTYLSKFPQIFEAMMGKRPNSEDISNLNKILPDILEQNVGVDTNIILLYSTKEITYETETIDLLNKLKDCNYNINEIMFDFPEHEMIGPVFADYLSKKFCINSN